MNTKKMPTFRQRVTTYFRQLSFIAEPREEEIVNREDGSFITKYLEGRLDPAPGPIILHGKDLVDLPEMLLMRYDTGSDKITAATTGPDEGLIGIKRSRLHLSAGIADIDFIDTPDIEPPPVSKTKTKTTGRSDPNANEKKVPSSSRRSSVTQKPNATSKTQESLKLKTDNNSNKQPQPPSQDSFKISTKFSTSTNSIHNLDSLNKNFNELDKKLSQYSINKTEDDGLKGGGQTVEEVPLIKESIAGVTNWANATDEAFGISVSLYEKSQISGEHAGSPIADCFGMVARGNSCAMALADGVNWGEGARLAARSAIQGSLEYIDTAVFGQGPGGTATTTREVFISLLRSFWEAHACILETGGSLTTLTVVIILPLSDDKYFGQYVCCCCNVGDSLGYVYSKVHGVREFTQFSHNINDMRDMRDALGALGPVDGNKPELGNLTLSMTIVDPGDIVFLTSDGISDNFDPVVGKFAEAFFSASQIAQTAPSTVQPKLAPKKQNKSTSYIHSKPTSDSVTSTENIQKLPNKTRPTSSFAELPPVRPPRTKKSGSTVAEPVKSAEKENIPSRPKYSRSHTVIEPRMKLKKSPAQPTQPTIQFPKSLNGLPLVTGPQRHALTLLRLADLFNFGINGSLRPCATSKKLCQLLIDFVTMITTAKRKMLEQRELFYKTSFDPAGTKRETEMTRNQQRNARKKVVESAIFQSLPGKLDHASVVAFKIGSCCRNNRNNNYNETDF